MTRRMLDSLELSLLPSSSPPTAQLSSLISSDHKLGGVYKPLLLRPTSATYEERFEHHQKKKRTQKDENHDHQDT